MESMTWYEILPKNGGGGGGGGRSNNMGGGVNNNNMTNNNNNTERVAAVAGGGSSSSSSSNAPTIKNHSVTHFGDYLYCFGGYDGRRNHATLLLYSLKEEKWIRPLHVPDTAAAALARGGNNDDDDDDNVDDAYVANDNQMGPEEGDPAPEEEDEQENDDDDSAEMGEGANRDDFNADGNNDARRRRRGEDLMHFAHRLNGVDIVPPPPNDPTAVMLTGNPPPGRNGHSATLAVDPDDPECACIIIVGGWLGTGPLAASDMHVLHIRNHRSQNYLALGGGGDDVDDDDDDDNITIDNSDEDTVTMSNHSSNGNNGHSNNDNSDEISLDIAERFERRMQRRSARRSQQQQAVAEATAVHAVASDHLPLSRPTLRWSCPTVRGTPPGPCNMHSADYIKKRQEVYLFRGGNGREYLNDLHALCTNTYVWRRVETTGEIPQQRANHSSAVLDETGELFIFGGWNGTERLNDIHILDTETSNWTRPHIGGILPHPRAGMTLTALRGRLFLFGGSGTSSKCYYDLQILDREQMAWLDVTPYEGNSRSHSNNQSRHQIVGDDPSLMGRSNPNMMDVDVLGGTQDGSSGSRRAGSFTSSVYGDWRSREMGISARSSGVANPNDEDTIPTVLLHGRGPGQRAGHTATAVGSKIFVFGGSCGSDYLNDFFVLDSDPAPHAIVSEPTSLHLIERRLRHFFNDEEFSDVTFVVQGRRVYGHKMILAIVSDCFRAMFTAGFRESSSSEIEITDCTYEAFLAVMDYIYTGAIPPEITTQQQAVLDIMTPQQRHQHQQRQQSELSQIVDVLQLADRFMLDHLKQVCEQMLQPAVTNETLECLFQVAQKTNAVQLLAICEHFARNRRVSN